MLRLLYECIVGKYVIADQSGMNGAKSEIIEYLRETDPVKNQKPNQNHEIGNSPSRRRKIGGAERNKRFELKT